MEVVSSRQSTEPCSVKERKEEGQLSGRSVRFPTTLIHTIEASCLFLERLSCGHLVGGSRESFVAVWDPKERFRELFQEKVHDQEITAMHAQSGDKLAVGFRDGVVKCLEWNQGILWTNAILNPESTFAKPVLAIDTLPESGNLVVGHESGISAWDTKGQQLYTKQWVFKLKTEQWVSKLQNLKVLPDGRIYFRFGGFTTIWNPVTGKEINPKRPQLGWVNYTGSCIAIKALSQYHITEVFERVKVEEVYLENPPYTTYPLYYTGVFRMSAAETVAEEVLVIGSSCDREVRIFEFKKYDRHRYDVVSHLIDLASEIDPFDAPYALKVLEGGRLAVATSYKILIYS